MQALTIQAPSRRLLTMKPLVAALTVAASCAAWGDEPNPYYIGGKVTGGRDSNVFRVPDGPHDYIVTTTLLGGFDQMISRQHLYLNADVDWNKYHNFDQLNNTSYAVKAGWDWATIENLSGSFNGEANRNLATFYGNAAVPTETRNLVKSNQVGANVKWGGENLLTLEGSYAHSQVNYSASDYLANDSSADTGSIGGYYRAGPSLKLGLAVRETRTDAPHAIPLVANPAGPGDYAENKTNGHNFDLLAIWTYSAQTAVNARVSYTKQTNSNAAVQDFSGVTGAISATYAPTGKLNFEAQYIRDAGSNATFFNVASTQTTTGPVFGLNQGSTTTDLASIKVRYAATAKINANAAYVYRRSKILNTQVVNGAATPANQNDQLNTVTLGVTYDIARAWQLGCNLSREKRDVSGAPAFAYNDTTTNCSVQFLLK